ncbi:hypothetical protein SEMRO_991_G228690.1 [Seminavis robusta]|uniref:DUF6824 domain-containing protein n=1 Tax=Seminavis robusta TaxID=568900 RepID=A0A9N8HNJ1_9STRA|nr:hypothetical protein SEMRO_991_G228690.1 [Seminavis robusta]|eukprot:Sro991_g228690.1 n/a (298) ;mRNA; r:14439-15332
MPQTKTMEKLAMKDEEATKCCNDKEQQLGAVGLPSPLPMDITMGRGGMSNNHSGNKLSREIVAMYYGAFLQAQGPTSRRKDKGVVVNTVYEHLTKEGFRFVLRVNGLWVEAPFCKARAKIIQALREGSFDLRNNVPFSTSAAARKRLRKTKEKTKVCKKSPKGSSPKAQAMHKRPSITCGDEPSVVTLETCDSSTVDLLEEDKFFTSVEMVANGEEETIQEDLEPLPLQEDSMEPLPLSYDSDESEVTLDLEPRPLPPEQPLVVTTPSFPSTPSSSMGIGDDEACLDVLPELMGLDF